eukprot:2333583-Pleurochrysis_carterae.AAC.5
MQAVSAPTSAPAAKRARTESGLKEGEQVRVQPEASVVLQPAGHSIPVPFDGEMPGELAATVPWILSHADKDADGASIAHIMSLPCAIGSKRYPLFFFYGSVPMKHLVTSSGAPKCRAFGCFFHARGAPQTSVLSTSCTLLSPVDLDDARQSACSCHPCAQNSVLYLQCASASSGWAAPAKRSMRKCDAHCPPRAQGYEIVDRFGCTAVQLEYRYLRAIIDCTAARAHCPVGIALQVGNCSLLVKMVYTIKGLRWYGASTSRSFTRQGTEYVIVTVFA